MISFSKLKANPGKDVERPWRAAPNPVRKRRNVAVAAGEFTFGSIVDAIKRAYANQRKPIASLPERPEPASRPPGTLVQRKCLPSTFQRLSREVVVLLDQKHDRLIYLVGCSSEEPSTDRIVEQLRALLRTAAAPYVHLMALPARLRVALLREFPGGSPIIGQVPLPQHLVDPVDLQSQRLDGQLQGAAFQPQSQPQQQHQRTGGVLGLLYGSPDGPSWRAAGDAAVTRNSKGADADRSAHFEEPVDLPNEVLSRRKKMRRLMAWRKGASPSVALRRDSRRPYKFQEVISNFNQLGDMTAFMPGPGILYIRNNVADSLDIDVRARELPRIRDLEDAAFQIRIQLAAGEAEQDDESEVGVAGEDDVEGENDVDDDDDEDVSMLDAEDLEGIPDDDIRNLARALQGMGLIRVEDSDDEDDVDMVQGEEEEEEDNDDADGELERGLSILGMVAGADDVQIVSFTRPGVVDGVGNGGDGGDDEDDIDGDEDMSFDVEMPLVEGPMGWRVFLQTKLGQSGADGGDGGTSAGSRRDGSGGYTAESQQAEAERLANVRRLELLWEKEAHLQPRRPVNSDEGEDDNEEACLEGIQGLEADWRQANGLAAAGAKAMGRMRRGTAPASSDKSRGSAVPTGSGPGPASGPGAGAGAKTGPAVPADKLIRPSWRPAAPPAGAGAGMSLSASAAAPGQPHTTTAATSSSAPPSVTATPTAADHAEGAGAPGVGALQPQAPGREPAAGFVPTPTAAPTATGTPDGIGLVSSTRTRRGTALKAGAAMPGTAAGASRPAEQQQEQPHEEQQQLQAGARAAGPQPSPDDEAAPSSSGHAASSPRATTGRARMVRRPSQPALRPHREGGHPPSTVAGGPAAAGGTGPQSPHDSHSAPDGGLISVPAYHIFRQPGSGAGAASSVDGPRSHPLAPGHPRLPLGQHPSASAATPPPPHGSMGAGPGGGAGHPMGASDGAPPSQAPVLRSSSSPSPTPPSESTAFVPLELQKMAEMMLGPQATVEETMDLARAMEQSKEVDAALLSPAEQTPWEAGRPPVPPVPPPTATAMTAAMANAFDGLRGYSRQRPGTSPQSIFEILRREVSHGRRSAVTPRRRRLEIPVRVRALMHAQKIAGWTEEEAAREGQVRAALGPSPQQQTAAAGEDLSSEEELLPADGAVQIFGGAQQLEQQQAEALVAFLRGRRSAAAAAGAGSDSGTQARRPLGEGLPGLTPGRDAVVVLPQGLLDVVAGAWQLAEEQVMHPDLRREAGLA